MFALRQPSPVDVSPQPKNSVNMARPPPNNARGRPRHQPDVSPFSAVASQRPRPRLFSSPYYVDLAALPAPIELSETSTRPGSAQKGGTPLEFGNHRRYGEPSRQYTGRDSLGAFGRVGDSSRGQAGQSWDYSQADTRSRNHGPSAWNTCPPFVAPERSGYPEVMFGNSAPVQRAEPNPLNINPFSGYGAQGPSRGHTGFQATRTSTSPTPESVVPPTLQLNATAPQVTTPVANIGPPAPRSQWKWDSRVKYDTLCYPGHIRKPPHEDTEEDRQIWGWAQAQLDLRAGDIAEQYQRRRRGADYTALDTVPEGFQLVLKQFKGMWEIYSQLEAVRQAQLIDPLPERMKQNGAVRQS